MEKFTIEVQTNIGWITYHSILRQGQEKAVSIVEELRSKFPKATFRVVKWVGHAISE